MSMRYPGGLIATSPVNARYPSGVWTQAQAAPYQAQNVWTRDQFWPNTTLLLQGDGAVNGAQNNTFLDSSSNNFTITRNGNTTQGAFTPYEQDGYWSNYFDGNGDYLTAPNNTALDLSTGDFTVEFWFYPTVGNQSAAMVNRHNGNYSTPNDFQFGVYLSSGNLVVRPYQGTTDYTTVVGAAQTNAWNHAAFVRTGNTFYGFLNGVRGTTSQTISGALNNSTWATYLGAALSASLGNDFFTGYLSNVRIVKGTALYTSSFTPSAAPLTAITNTSLLTCQSNRFKDNSTNNFTLTVNGNTSVQAFQPFPGATTWSASVLGGSGYFDGSGDTLSVASNAAFGFGTGDFTVELFVYCSFNGAVQEFIDARATGTAVPWVFGITGTGVARTYDGSTVRTGGQLFANAWNHVAWVRASNVNTVYVNGVSGHTWTASQDFGSSKPILVGDNIGGGEPFAGYISNLRIVKGTAVYTSAFTPPTAPLTAITNTSLLLNFTNAGIYDNSMMNNLETVGNAQVSTSVVKYGTGSMYFDGNGDYLLPPSSPNLAFGTGDCTIEFWYYANSSQGTRTILVGNNLGFTTNAWNIQINNTSPSITNKLQLWAYNLNSSAVAIQGNTTLVANNWYHVALVRNGSTFTFYLNGVSEGTTTSSASLDGGGSKTISIARDGTDYFNGYIDDLRITKGAARYITNFTPPPARMPGQ